MRYWKGEKLVGGEQKRSEAMYWIEKAAERGFKKAVKFLDEQEKKDLTTLDGQLEVAKASEAKGEWDKALEVLAISANNPKQEESSAEALISFVKRYLTKFEVEGEYDKALSMLNDALMKCVALGKSSIPSEFVIRYAHRLFDSGSMKKALNLLDTTTVSGEDVEAEKQRLRKVFYDVTIQEANQCEVAQNFKAASVAYEKIADTEEGNVAYLAFLVRWAKIESGADNPLETYNVLNKVKSLGFDETGELEHIEKDLRNRYGALVDVFEMLNSCQSYEELTKLEKQEHLEETVAKLGYEAYYAKSKAGLICKFMSDCVTIQGLQRYETIAAENGLEDEYSDCFNVFAKTKEKISETANLAELAELEDIAYRQGLEEDFFEQIWKLTELDEVKENYGKFKKDESRVEIVNSFVEWLYKDEIMYWDLDESDEIWNDLSDGKEIVTYNKWWYYMHDGDDVGLAFKYYCSDYFEDFSNGLLADEEMNAALLDLKAYDRLELFLEFGDYETLEEKLCGYGDLYDFFEGFDLLSAEDILNLAVSNYVDLDELAHYFEYPGDDLLYKLGEYEESLDDIGLAVEYYKKAYEVYGDYHAYDRLIKLYKE